MATPIRPSAATRPAFLAAFDRPFLRSQSTAASMSPSVSPSAALQSIMPAPVVSRRSLTICAVMLAIFVDPSIAGSGSRSGGTRSGLRRYRRVHRAVIPRRSSSFALRDPALRRGQADPTSSPIVVGAAGLELGDLPVVEDAEIVELLLDRRRDVRRAS